MGTYGIDTAAFRNQINLNMTQCWAIVKELCDFIYAQEDAVGEYVFMKDPSKAVMRLLKVTAEEDEDEDEEEVEL